MERKKKKIQIQSDPVLVSSISTRSSQLYPARQEACFFTRLSVRLSSSVESSQQTCLNFFSPQKMIFLRFCHCGFRQISPLVRLMFPGGHLHVHPKIRSFFLLPIILLFSFLFFSFYLLFSSFFLLFFFLPIENPFNCEYSLLFHISYFLHAIAFHCIQRLFRLPCITLQGFLVFLAYIILAFQCLSFLSISSFPFFFLSLFLSLFYFYIPCILRFSFSY